MSVIDFAFLLLNCLIITASLFEGSKLLQAERNVVLKAAYQKPVTKRRYNIGWLALSAKKASLALPMPKAPLRWPCLLLLVLC